MILRRRVSALKCWFRKIFKVAINKDHAELMILRLMKTCSLS